MAIVAAQQALGRTAPLSGPQTVSAVEHYGGDRLGVVLGTGLGMLDLTLEFLAQMVQEGPAAASPATFPYTVMNAGAALVAMELGLRGPNVTVNHRDLSAHEALAHGCDLLHLGRADALLVGGWSIWVIPRCIFSMVDMPGGSANTGAQTGAWPIARAQAAASSLRPNALCAPQSKRSSASSRSAG